jgi:GNAT superfamily N-acetyltransferase
MARLRTGEEVEIRPVEPGDREAVRRGFNRLGEETRYRRFLSPIARLTEDQLTYLVEVDHHDHEALLAIHDGEVAGVARYVRDSSAKASAEVAVVVNDEWQGKGLGSALLNQLADRAREDGVTTFTAAVLADNSTVIDMLGALGSVHSEPAGSGTVNLEIELDGMDQLEVLLRGAASGVMEFVSRWGRRLPGAPT